jgi:hypothetical protein
MCCGQKRAELSNSQSQRMTPNIPRSISGNSRAQALRTHPPTAPATQTALPRPAVNGQMPSIQLQAATTTSIPHSSVSVRYLENSPIRVRGLVSGLCYEFSGSRAIQQVDARDASSLLNTRFFRRT